MFASSKILCLAVRAIFIH